MQSWNNLNNLFTTVSGLQNEMPALQTREEIEHEMQEGKDRYLRGSLKLKQMQVDSEIEKVNQAKCKVVKQREKVLQRIDNARHILQNTCELIESSKLMDNDDQQKIRDILSVKRVEVAKIYKKLEEDKETEKKKLVEKLEKEQKQISDAVTKMDKEIEKIVRIEKAKRFVYKKLELVGKTEEKNK